MSITVYPRLGELLRERKMSVAELARQIEARWGRSVDPKTLYRLTADEPIKRVEIGLVAQIAAVLELGMEELFDVLAFTLDVELYEEFDDLLTREQYLRMRELFDLKLTRTLRQAETKELKALVELHALHSHERTMERVAAERGVSVELVEAESAARIAEAVKWWRSAEAKALRRSLMVTTHEQR